MREFEIVFTKSKKKYAIGSWLIRWWTKKEYSHVAIKRQIRDWGYRYYQSSEGKVNYEFETVFENKHEIIKKYKIQVSKEMDNKIKKACYQDAGKDYGYLQNFGIFLVDVFKLKKNPFKSGSNCSEILYENCFKILYPELNYDKNTIKPHHIEEILEKNNDCSA